MSATGTRGVYVNRGRSGKPFYASIKRDGKQQHLGYVATIEEGAALVAATEPPEPRHRIRGRSGKFISQERG